MNNFSELVSRLDDDDAIVAMSNRSDEASHVVPDHADAAFTWNYTKGERPRLESLYEKAKRSQWNAETDIDWTVDVDIEAQAHEAFAMAEPMGNYIDLEGTGLELWGDAEWLQFEQENADWMLSQFLHGEQGALLATAKIVETVPWYDAKLYAATQAMDEARHVEVFAKYLQTKRPNNMYPVNAHLGMLLDDIVADSRWDMTYLGMQIMVEGLALAAFGFMYQTTTEPLLKQLLRYVMADEARHVAFGVLSLQEIYQELDAHEIRERQEFAFEAAIRMRDRFLVQEVWDRMGIDPAKISPRMMASPESRAFQHLLFTKIVPNCAKLGLLDAGDGWLRTKFGEIGVLQYEGWADTLEEVDALQLS